MSALLLAAEPTNFWEWLHESSTRTITGPIPHNLWLTLWHALAAGAIAVVLTVPVAVFLAHHRKAELAASWIVNLGRIIPTVTILAFAVVISLRNGLGFAPYPILFALTLLAIPPIFANTYTAVRQASPDAVSSARAMGLTERQIMTGVELPLALPLILTGVRTALTQLVATEALGALFGGGGLGIYVRFGFAGDDIYQIQAGALLVAAAAMGTDLVLAVVARLVVPKGVRARPGRRRAATVTVRAPDVASAAGAG
ncbi:ABC transporter permease subunit [Aquihabitans sp. G128]|uniref:ABC transporter permease n=1 Tax=Aquihabitans sp. G128 TaxID=2849779 RepID=UPI001C24CEF2|nr:ABC transporter permease subunit [Aquihabitans sp. G128]QXC63210.1 ABC transporter permease subunit [Aquihabitans sp. G128]